MWHLARVLDTSLTLASWVQCLSYFFCLSTRLAVTLFKVVSTSLIFLLIFPCSAATKVAQVLRWSSYLCNIRHSGAESSLDKISAWSAWLPCMIGKNVGISCNLTRSMSALLSILSLLTVTKVLWADCARRLLFNDLESRGDENLPDLGFTTFLGLSPIGLLTV